MSSGIEYIDIILLAMIAGFIILRLKNILGRKTGFQRRPDLGRSSAIFDAVLHDHANNKNNNKTKLNKEEEKYFLNGARISYETIISALAAGDKKTLKLLTSREMYDEFLQALEERNKKQLKYETTFIGIKSANIKEFKKENSVYKITVGFVSEMISCIKDKDNNIVEGNPDIIKTVKDVWKFSKNMWSHNPTWYLVDTTE